MIKKTTNDKWLAYCDGDCQTFSPVWDDRFRLHKWLSDQGWLFGDGHKNVLSFCYECSQKLKRKEPVKEEKKSPVCIARDGEFYTTASFCESISKCPHADKDTGCPARKYVLWKYQYTHWITTRDVYKIHRSPEFLAACSRCLGESKYSVVNAEVTTDDRVDLLEKRVDKITEGYERMFGYLDIISKAVMTIIREKEEKKND